VFHTYKITAQDQMDCGRRAGIAAPSAGSFPAMATIRQSDHCGPRAATA
jgi:hypothetical protein